MSTDQLTVQDLIDTLLKIEDKSSDVRIQTQRDTDDGYFENQWLSSVDVVTNGYDDRDKNYNAFKDVMLGDRETNTLTVKDLIDKLSLLLLNNNLYEGGKSEVMILTKRDIDEDYAETQWLSSVEVETLDYIDKNGYNATMNEIIISD